ncbi:hypothetical protein BZA77DRAFT_377440 [Pyronema omphalodes]|nr:hypothetical protein BZA77DRAFT_377440 [Pyronema omphalodes]
MSTPDTSLAARLAALRGPSKPPPRDDELTTRFEKLFSHSPGASSVAPDEAVVSDGVHPDERQKTEIENITGDDEDYEVKARELLKLTKQRDEEAGKDIRLLIKEAEDAGRGLNREGDKEEVGRLLKRADEEGWSTTAENGGDEDDGDWDGEPSWLEDATLQGGGNAYDEGLNGDRERCYRSSAPSPEPMPRDSVYAEDGGYEMGVGNVGLELPAVPKELRMVEEKQGITGFLDAPGDEDADQEADAIVRRIKEEIEWEKRRGIKDSDDEDNQDSDDQEAKRGDSDEDSGDEVPAKGIATMKQEKPEKTQTNKPENDDSILSKLSARFAALGGMDKKSNPTPTSSSKSTPSKDTVPSSGGLLDLPSVPTGLSLPSAPSSKPKTKTKKKHEEVDEVDTWCCICTEDAEWRCEGCEGDIYCGSCIYEAHTGVEEKRHRWGRYVKPGRRLVGA